MKCTWLQNLEIKNGSEVTSDKLYVMSFSKMTDVEIIGQFLLY
jgi:hypothetical protein